MREFYIEGISGRKQRMIMSGGGVRGVRQDG